MRQVCNVSYAIQAEALDDKNGDYQRWHVRLNTPPPGWLAQTRRSIVDPSLDRLMAPGG